MELRHGLDGVPAVREHLLGHLALPLRLGLARPLDLRLLLGEKPRLRVVPRVDRVDLLLLLGGDLGVHALPEVLLVLRLLLSALPLFPRRALPFRPAQLDLPLALLLALGLVPRPRLGDLLLPRRLVRLALRERRERLRHEVVKVLLGVRLDALLRAHDRQEHAPLAEADRLAQGRDEVLAERPHVARARLERLKKSKEG